jgi:hypothetical protein
MNEEERDMSNIKLKAFVRETMIDLVDRATPAERLAGVPPEELRQRLSVKDRLKGLSAKELVQGLPLEVLEALAHRFQIDGSATKMA